MPKIYHWRELFSAQGRYGRGEFWGTAIPIAILNAVLGFLSWMSSGVLAPLVFLLSLPLMFIGVVNVAKRLHDHGKSGWWQAAVWGTLFVFGFIGGLMPSNLLVEGIVGLITVGAMIGALIYLGFIPGEWASNRFGPSKSDNAPDRGDLSSS
jgi:uncharacterized membrane protein YhaH (DUF805 family)